MGLGEGNLGVTGKVVTTRVLAPEREGEVEGKVLS